MKASIKRLLNKGTALTMIRYEKTEGVDYEVYNPETKTFWNNKMLKERKIDIVQTNAIRFEWGSWLYFWPAPQSEWIEEWKSFKVWDIYKGEKQNILTYNIK